MRNRCLIIAEAGVNHNGNPNTALKLCDAAKEAGADIVKFQIFDPVSLVCTRAEKAEYQLRNDGTEGNQRQMLERLKLSNEDFRNIKRHCDDIGIEFLATAFDMKSLAFLNELGVKRAKIPSGEITNLPYLRRCAEYWSDIIISTGMCTIADVTAAYALFPNHRVCLLHCTTDYPAPYGDVNLKCIETLRDRFGCETGYSDHTIGTEIPVAAVALGASVLEKHFTLDKDMEGPDHAASLEPSEFAAMTRMVRNIEISLGDGVKRIGEYERKNLTVARKSIVAQKYIRKGEFFTEENITAKRPGDGLSPMRWDEVVGQRAKRDFACEEKIEL